MKRVSDTSELRAEMLKNKDAFIGKTVVIGNGFKFLIVDITEKQINALPFDSLIGMKKDELEKYLTQFFALDKIETAIVEVESRKKDINEIYS